MPPTRRWTPWAAALAGVAAVLLSVPPLRALIEQSMVWHMLVQMPLLVGAGWLAAAAVHGRRAEPPSSPGGLARFNQYGMTGFLLAQLIAAYWMLPSSIDRAVVLPAVDAAKLASLWVCGVVLRDAIRRSPAPVQIFFVGYTLPMMIWLGLYLAGTDLRLCNAYPLASQINAGKGLVALSLALGAGWMSSLGWRKLYESA